MNSDAHDLLINAVAVVVLAIFIFIVHSIQCVSQSQDEPVVQYPSMVVWPGTETFIVQDVLGTIDSLGTLRAITIKSPETGMETLAIVSPGQEIVSGAEVPVTIMTFKKDRESLQSFFFACGGEKVEKPL